MSRLRWKLLSWLPAAYLTHRFVVTVYPYPTDTAVSFYPFRFYSFATSSTSSWALVDRWTATLGWPYEVGDEVLYWSTREPQKLLRGRLLALEGDTVRYRDVGDSLMKSCPLQQGQCWIEGDAAGEDDSRTLGPIYLALIEARPLCKLWPQCTWIRRQLTTKQRYRVSYRGIPDPWR